MSDKIYFCVNYDSDASDSNIIVSQHIKSGYGNMKFGSCGNCFGNPKDNQDKIFFVNSSNIIVDDKSITIQSLCCHNVVDYQKVFEQIRIQDNSIFEVPRQLIIGNIASFYGQKNKGSWYAILRDILKSFHTVTVSDGKTSLKFISTVLSVQSVKIFEVDFQNTKFKYEKEQQKLIVRKIQLQHLQHYIRNIHITNLQIEILIHIRGRPVNFTETKSKITVCHIENFRIGNGLYDLDNQTKTAVVDFLSICGDSLKSLSLGRNMVECFNEMSKRKSIQWSELRSVVLGDRNDMDDIDKEFVESSPLMFPVLTDIKIKHSNSAIIIPKLKSINLYEMIAENGLYNNYAVLMTKSKRNMIAASTWKLLAMKYFSDYFNKDIRDKVAYIITHVDTTTMGFIEPPLDIHPAWDELNEKQDKFENSKSKTIKLSGTLKYIDDSIENTKLKLQKLKKQKRKKEKKLAKNSKNVTKSHKELESCRSKLMSQIEFM